MHAIMLATYFATCPFSSEIDAIEEHKQSHLDAYEQIVHIQHLLGRMEKNCSAEQWIAIEMMRERLEMLQDCID